MKNITQIKNELSKNELLKQADLANILGGRKHRKSKSHRETEFVTSVYYLSASNVDTTEVVQDDKRRARPGGGTTTTSPNSLF